MASYFRERGGKVLNPGLPPLWRDKNGDPNEGNGR